MILRRRLSISIRLALAVGGLAFACHDHAKELEDRDESPRAPTADAMQTAPASFAPKARSPTDATQREHEMESLVRDWNTAINAHDPMLLFGLYDDPVEIYGTRMSRNDALAAKKGSFAKHLRDELSKIVITRTGHAQFEKKSTGRDGKVLEVEGYLDARDVKEKWLIVAEGDTTTDTNLQRARASHCLSAVMNLVYATAEAQKAMSDIEEGAKRAPVDDPVTVGGMVNPDMDPAYFATLPTWTVAICENHRDRMPCYHYFDVDRITGAVTYSLADVDAGPLKTDPALLARVREVCK